MSENVNMIQTMGFNYWPPNELISKNKLVACTPFPKQSIEKKLNRGMVMAEHKISMQELEVLFTSENYAKGQRVYVRGDRIMQPWAKEVFTIEDKEFILVPEAEVVFSKTIVDGPAFLPTVRFENAGVAPQQPPTFTTVTVGGPVEQSTTTSTQPSTPHGCGGPPRGTDGT